MKICYIVPDLGIPVDGQKGASSHIRGFVGALRDLGHVVTIFSSCGSSSSEPITLPDFLKGLREKDDPHLFRALRHIWNNVSVEQALKMHIANDKPDLIYERYSPFSVAAGIIAKQNKIPHILEVNAPLAEQGKRYRKQALQEASEYLEMTAFKNAGKIVSLTHELKDWLVSEGIDSEKIIIRPCAVDEELFSPMGPKKELPGEIVLGFVGSLKPWHDIEMLANTFRQLATDPKYHLLVVGDGPMREVLDKLAAELPGRVTLTGAVPQEEVPEYIRSMDIALAPYPDLELFYFSPLKAFESMACGKPIIATGIGQLNSLIDHGRTGLLVPPDDIHQFVEAINYLATDPELRIQMGKNAAKDIQEKHTWEKRALLFMGTIKENSLMLT